MRGSSRERIPQFFAIEMDEDEELILLMMMQQVCFDIYAMYIFCYFLLLWIIKRSLLLPLLVLHLIGPRHWAKDEERASNDEESVIWGSLLLSFFLSFLFLSAFLVFTLLIYPDDDSLWWVPDEEYLNLALIWVIIIIERSSFDPFLREHSREFAPKFNDLKMRRNGN